MSGELADTLNYTTGDTRAAYAVWSIPELRERIFRHVDRPSLCSLLIACQDTLPEVTSRLYHDLDNKQYEKLAANNVPSVSRIECLIILQLC